MRRVTARPVVELLRLLDAVMFNVLVGNNDAHGKNYSLLHRADGIELAPLYDLTCTVAYRALSPRFAMRLGDQHLFEHLYPRHWDRFAKEVELSPSRVRHRLRDLAGRLAAAAPVTRDAFRDRGQWRPVLDTVVERVRSQCPQTLDRLSDTSGRNENTPGHA